MSILRLSDSDSSRYVLLKGRGVRQECRRIMLPGHWSNMQKGMLVRSERVPDLLASAPYLGVYIIDVRVTP